MEGAARTLALFAVLGLWGCAPVTVGPDPDFVWWTDNESGDLSAWKRAGSTWESGGGSLAVVSAPVRSGRYAVRSTVAAQPSGTISGAVLVAENMPQEAYYSAWFWVPETVPSSTYWTFFKLASRMVPTDSTTGLDVWDFDLDPASDGGVKLRLFHHPPIDVAPLVAKTVPLARWFQVEAHYRASTTDDGELLLWLDDTLLFEIHGPTAPTSYVAWTIGGATEDLGLPQASVLLDDAAVTTRRLGTQFPPFYSR
jgi:hypothetical protein